MKIERVRSQIVRLPAERLWLTARAFPARPATSWS